MMLRAFLRNAFARLIGTGPTPVETAKPTAPEPTVEPAKSRGGRPPTYHQGKPSTPAERQRRARWKAQGKGRHETFRDSHETRHETLPLKEEEQKKEGAPISKDWRPDVDGERLGKEVFGDQYEAQVAYHIDHCLQADYRSHNHDATWRKRCRYFQLNPQLPLDLRPRARQLGVKNGGRTRELEPLIERAARLEKETLQARENAPTPATQEEKERVEAALAKFRGREASGCATAAGSVRNHRAGRTPGNLTGV